MGTPGYLLLAAAPAGRTGDRPVRAALEVLAGAGPTELVSCRQPGQLEDALSRRGDRTLVVAGGDGTLHLALRALHADGRLADTPLGLVPLGTGNDFARSAGVPLEPGEAARRILHGGCR
jgi:diacylglycerol kinase (ATP)